MNKEQRNLVKFIMSMDEDQFDTWTNTVSLEEINEATLAIKLAREEADKAIQYIEEEELQNLTDAREVLAQFTLNGLQ